MSLGPAEAAYSQRVVDHFEHPRNVGRLTAPDTFAGAAGRVSQGVRFELSARAVQGRICELRFVAYGCPHCIAAGSWLSERLQGATRQDLLEWRWLEAAEALDVPAEKRGRLLLLEDAVRALASGWGARVRS